MADFTIHENRFGDLSSPDPDETGFDSDLRALARTLVGELTEQLWPGRAWNEDSVFRAMQTAGTIAVRSGEAKADALRSCEQLGRRYAESIARRTAAVG